MTNLLSIKSVLFILFCSFSIISFSQYDIKQLKKDIPVKGIKSIESIYSDYLVIYRAKKDTGIYDLQSRKVVLHHVLDFYKSQYRDNWFEYSTVSGFGLYDVARSKSLLSSSTKYSLHYSEDSNLVNVIGTELYGFLDRSRNAAYCSIPISRSDTTFFEGHYEDPSCFRVDGSISYGYGDYDGVENYSTIYPLTNFIIENSNIYNRNTGAFVRKIEGTCFEWNNLIIRSGYRGDAYYDLNFNQVITETALEDYTAEELSFLVGINIESTAYTGSNGVYLCQIKGRPRFYSIIERSWTSPEYDHVFPMGRDFNIGGVSYYTVKENIGFGLYNTYEDVILTADNAYVELRAFTNGDFWYRSNNEYTKAGAEKGEPIVTQKMDPIEAKNSTIINHLGVFGSNLVVSPRSTSADTHDSGYYTATYFDDGAGVIDLDDLTWKIKPIYHTFTPYKGHFIAMRDGSTYRNASWLQTTLFDGSLQRVETEKFGASFIFMDRLFMLKGSQLIEYDVLSKKELRTLGNMDRVDADFRIEDDYFFIGNNNYDAYDKSLIGMDITEIINPKCELVNISIKDRHRYLSYIGEELVIIGRIMKGEPTDREIHRLKVDKFAIFDLRNNKMLTDWYDRITLKYGGDGIYYNKSMEDDTGELKTSEIREKLKLR